jgi:hypothetical protein
MFCLWWSDSSCRWYWWNCWSLLFKFSFHNIYTLPMCMHQLKMMTFFFFSNMRHNSRPGPIQNTKKTRCPFAGFYTTTEKVYYTTNKRALDSKYKYKYITFSYHNTIYRYARPWNIVVLSRFTNRVTFLDIKNLCKRKIKTWWATEVWTWKIQKLWFRIHMLKIEILHMLYMA